MYFFNVSFDYLYRNSYAQGRVSSLIHSGTITRVITGRPAPYLINNEMHVDGGYYDNLPINLAIDLGATEIIAVDLRAIGFKKTIKDKSVDITYITPNNKIGSFLVFDKTQAKKAIKLGYNDTMKKFNKLEGHKFTFKRYNLIKNYNKYIDFFEQNLNNIFNSEHKILNQIFKSKLFI